MFFLNRLFHRYGVSGSALNWFKTYFINRNQSVVINNSLSKPHVPIEGAPQGSVGVRTTRHIYKLAPNIQTCPIVKSPQFKLAPNTNSPHFLCMVSTVRAWFVLVVFYHRSNVYPALQVMVLVYKRRDRSMLCVLSHVNNAIELY